MAKKGGKKPPPFTKKGQSKVMKGVGKSTKPKGTSMTGRGYTS